MPDQPTVERCARRSRPGGVFAAGLLLSALLTGAPAAAGIEAGAKGRATFPGFDRLTPMTTPEHSTTGFLALFSVTKSICLGLATLDEDLAALAPVGFTIARSDVHGLGFEAPHFDGHRWAISVTGDSEKDEAAHHPYWIVSYGDEGTPAGCAMTWTPDPAAIDDEMRRRIVQWLYIGVPQLFGAVLTEPRFAGLTVPLEPQYMELQRPCPAGRCQITLVPLMRPDEWRINLEFRLR